MKELFIVIFIVFLWTFILNTLNIIDATVHVVILGFLSIILFRGIIK